MSLPPAISNAISTSVCVSVKTKNMCGAGQLTWSPLEPPPESQDVQDFLAPQTTATLSLQFLQLRSVAAGKAASKGLWF